MSRSASRSVRSTMRGGTEAVEGKRCVSTSTGILSRSEGSTSVMSSVTWSGVKMRPCQKSRSSRPVSWVSPSSRSTPSQSTKPSQTSLQVGASRSTKRRNPRASSTRRARRPTGSDEVFTGWPSRRTSEQFSRARSRLRRMPRGMTPRSLDPSARSAAISAGVATTLGPFTRPDARAVRVLRSGVSPSSVSRYRSKARAPSSRVRR